ncbi:hypothetical protein WJ78_01880 [Burkholderia ubonensis]|nr:hypothetical protein WJ78_01880 [Burkholderia ubonensis]KVP83194.1 hypothetical protein WJ94_03195 [Burkholderia ubonensis]KVP92404.1 hypothetical protein WJ97_22195 [Burkholderia ubonensis]KVR59321.1 hypothetical protein WK19_05970 [Burkholderia ubonensis]KWD51144.1 hypothetical protein WL65_07315 [Burkholderia ubonensis]
MYGDGRATEGGDMHWRAYEVSFGDVLNDYFSVYLSYLNEGHPVDHHRDGFAALGSFRWPVGNRLALEFSAGPHFNVEMAVLQIGQPIFRLDVHAQCRIFGRAARQ